MAYYAYKGVRDLLPQHIIDKQGPDYDGDANYDGDQWIAAADYIVELKDSVAAKDLELAERQATIKGLCDRLERINQICWASDKSGPAKLAEIKDWSGGFAEPPPDPNALAHPDAARLDKLPQCFHMLRTGVGRDALSQCWWLTYDPNKTFATMREAIDAYQEPKP